MKYMRTMKNIDVAVIQVLVEVMSVLLAFIDIDKCRKMNCECTRGRSDSFITASMT